MSNIVEKKRIYTYDRWWNMPIKTPVGYRVDRLNNKIITNGAYIRYFYSNLKKLIESKGYEIEDEKQLKSEVATLIYNLSEDTL